MPKLKTNRSAKKRFKITSKGKIKRYRAFKSHLMSSKASERKRRLKQVDFVSKQDAKRIKRLIGY